MKEMYENLRVSGKHDSVADNLRLTFSNILVRDLRLQQVTGGFWSPETLCPIDPDECQIPGTRAIEGVNPKLEDLKAYIHQIRDEEKAIIWCRFLPEMHLIAAALKQEYGEDSTVQFSGEQNADQRTESRNRFQTDSRCRFFVGIISAGGVGITLTAASYELYFSNSWSLRHRIQSEDRAHRIGQTKSVTYVDFVMEAPWVDRRILKALKDGKNYSEVLMQEIREATN